MYRTITPIDIYSSIWIYLLGQKRGFPASIMQDFTERATPPRTRLKGTNRYVDFKAIIPLLAFLGKDSTDRTLLFSHCIKCEWHRVDLAVEQAR
jgi:hypothetical protein